MIHNPNPNPSPKLQSNYKAKNLTPERAASVVNNKEIYFNAHVKMLNLYDDIPDQYSMQKMIYDDSKTLQDLIDKMQKTEKPKNDAKPYDYNNKTMPPMVKDENNGDCQTPDTLPETSETIKGGSMGLKIENKKSQKNEVSIHPPLCMIVLLCMMMCVLTLVLLRMCLAGTGE